MSDSGDDMAPGDPSPGEEQAPKERHDPGGLNLAHGIADAYRNKEARRPPRKRRGQQKRRPEPKAAGDHEPTTLSKLVGRMIEDNGWEDDLAIHRVFADWSRIVGPEVAQHCQVDSYADGQVNVRADSTAWATQLRMLAPQIVAKLNAELGDGSVVRLNIAGPQGPSWKSGRRSIKGARGPRDTYG